MISPWNLPWNPPGPGRGRVYPGPAHPIGQASHGAAQAGSARRGSKNWC